MLTPRKHKYEWDVLYLKCTKCWRWKTIDFFWKEKKALFWVRPECKKCHNKNNKITSEYRRKYYEENKEKIRQQNKDYYDNNREKCAQIRRNYLVNNRDKIQIRRRKWREANKDRLNQKHKIHIKEISNKLWFNIDNFHRRASQYANRHSLKPTICPICWLGAKIDIHHPSYSSYDNRCIVVFCCRMCHSKIHRWEIECPHPINLLLLKK